MYVVQSLQVYAMSVCGDYLVVCTASKHFWVWDSRNMVSVA